MVDSAFVANQKSSVQYRVCEMGLLDCCAPIVGRDENDTQIILAYLFFGQMRCGRGTPPRQTPPNPTLDPLLQLLPTAFDDAQRQQQRQRLDAAFRQVRDLSPRQYQTIDRSIRWASNLVNLAVQKLQESRRVADNAAFMEEAVRAGNLDDLLNLIVTDVPALIQAKYCSVFTVIRGHVSDGKSAADDDRLVLRRSSYPGLKKDENRAAYRMNEGLTGWVWAHKRSLRVNDVRNSAEVEALYPGAHWSGESGNKPKYPDSTDHYGFLCVPMFGPTGEVTGAIRMPHKINPLTHFTKQDETFLTFLARHLAWVFECQVLKDSRERAMALTRAVKAVLATRSEGELDEVATSHAQQLFRYGSEQKRHYVFCSCDQRKKTWKVARDIGNMSVKPENRQRTYGCEEGLAGWAMREKHACLEVDLADAERQGRYIGLVEGAESAMAAPLILDGETLGVIAIVSGEKFAFSSNGDLRTLGELAEACAEQMARLRSPRWRRFRHWLKDNIPWLEALTVLVIHGCRRLSGGP
jgi:GAF domain-containing protein